MHAHKSKAKVNGKAVTNSVGVMAANLKPTRVPSMRAAVILNGLVRHVMEIDTAADECLISYDLYKDMAKMDSNLSLATTTVVMRMADGMPSKAVRGVTTQMQQIRRVLYLSLL